MMSWIIFKNTVSSENAINEVHDNFVIIRDEFYLLSPIILYYVQNVNLKIIELRRNLLKDIYKFNSGKNIIILQSIKDEQYFISENGNFEIQGKIIPVISLERFVDYNTINTQLLNLLLNYQYADLITFINPFSFVKIPNKALFYGRDDILEHIRTSNKNYAITGPRRIGKTTLGKQIKSSNYQYTIYEGFLKKNDYINTIIYIDLSSLGYTDELYHDMILEFNYDQSIYLPYSRNIKKHVNFYKALKKLFQDYGGMITIIFDEVDSFIKEDKKNNYRILEPLRNLIDANGAKIILIGYETLAIEIKDTQFPFFGRIEEKRLIPLDKKSATNMVKNTFKMLRISIAKDFANFDEQIYSLTHGFPHLIQGLAFDLVDSLKDRKDRIISQNIFFSVKNTNQTLKMFDSSIFNLPSDLLRFICLIIAKYFHENEAKIINYYVLISEMKRHFPFIKEKTLRNSMVALDLRYILVGFHEEYKFSSDVYQKYFLNQYLKGGEEFLSILKSNINFNEY